MFVKLKCGDCLHLDLSVYVNIHHDVEVDVDVLKPALEKYLRANLCFLLGQDDVNEL